MASACFSTRDLLCCSQSLRRGNRQFRLLHDTNLLLRGNANFHGRPVRKQQHRHLIKAVAMVERTCFVPRENGCVNRSTGLDDDDVLQSPDDDDDEMDEKERLRRMRISKANKGNVPWNKGRKHSAVTLQRIRERTRIAMQDPKVKMKLVNLGHAQSEETRTKIGVGVREGWQRRREMLIVQERCFFEWQNMIAEASKAGYAGEDELQWDSYEILDEQLKIEWLESVEERRTMPRVKGSKRAPKSPEQRRRISEAISAKWADPGYRNRVYDALAKYHGTTIGVERKRRKKPIGEKSSVDKVATKKKPERPKETKVEPQIIKKVAPRRKRNSAPSYKDPMAKSKLEMIKKIKAKRTGMEMKKREATERAKLLIAEAERAAEALEVAALTSPLALASLKETRKLIAEAVRSIESIEGGKVRSQEEEVPFYSNGAINHFQTQRSADTDMLDERAINGSPLLQSSDSDYEDIDFDKFTLPDMVNAGDPSPASQDTKGSRSLLDFSPLRRTREDSSRTDFQIGQTKISGPIANNLPPKIEDKTLQGRHNGHPTSALKTKKWVCGRLVEVEAS